MNNTNEFLQDYMTLKQRMDSLTPHKPNIWRQSVMNLVLMILLYTVYCLFLISIHPVTNDGTDTGIGCIEDCLAKGE